MFLKNINNYTVSQDSKIPQNNVLVIINQSEFKTKQFLINLIDELY